MLAPHHNSLIESIYIKIIREVSRLTENATPYFRRLLRFLALPYCFMTCIDWNECPVSRLQVIKDFFYIFFVLKYYPDNYSQCRLWEKDRREWCYYYGSIYDPYQRGRLRREVQRKEYEILFDDKEVCYQLCKAAELPLPKQYLCVQPDDLYHGKIREILTSEPDKQLIIKPALGMGGKGIVIAYREGKDIFVRDKKIVVPLDGFHLHEKVVIQEYIGQHPSLSSIAPSVNTVRMVTLLTKQKNVIILGAYMRFGIGDAYLDNVSSGGIEVGIDIDHGLLRGCAFDEKGNRYQTHPTSHVVFNGHQIPSWSSVVQLAIKIQQSFPYYKLLGYDLAITPYGPVVIEINSAPDMVGLESAYGPILKDRLVWDAFREYDLLINQLSRHAWIKEESSMHSGKHLE